MSEKINDYLKKELIINKLDADNREDIFKASFKLLYSHGFVKKSFLDGLIKREETFPTGLRIGKYNVAIPHTDSIHVLSPAISVITLKRPVEFRCMDGDGKVSAKIIFTMALDKPHSQVVMLQQLMYLIQNQSLLEEVFEQNSTDAIYDTLANTKINIG